MVQALVNSECSNVSLPGDNLPYWLAYMGEGYSVSSLCLEIVTSKDWLYVLFICQPLKSWQLIILEVS